MGSVITMAEDKPEGYRVLEACANCRYVRHVLGLHPSGSTPISCFKHKQLVIQPNGHCPKWGKRIMKICWIGWTGPEMDQVGSGILAFDPEALFYEIGCGRSRDESYYFGTDKNRTDPTIHDPGILREYDVYIHNTYRYASGHRPSIFPAWGEPLPDQEFWKDLKGFKILHDGESFTQFKYYRDYVHHFDAVMTYNPSLKDYCDTKGIKCHLDFGGSPKQFTEGIVAPLDYKGISGLHETSHFQNRDIDVFFSGSNIFKGYRNEISEVLKSMTDINVVFSDGAMDALTIEDYVDHLRRSKIVMCTHSPATGEREPFHRKDREGGVLLCGALPITEYWEGSEGYLEGVYEKETFRNFPELINLINHFVGAEDHRSRIVKAGQKKIRENHLYEHVFRRAFEAFGLL